MSTTVWGTKAGTAEDVVGQLKDTAAQEPM